MLHDVPSVAGNLQLEVFARTCKRLKKGAELAYKHNLFLKDGGLYEWLIKLIHPTAKLKTHNEFNAVLTIARLDGVPVGCCLMTRYHYWYDVHPRLQVFVDPRYRRRGIGIALAVQTRKSYSRPTPVIVRAHDSAGFAFFGKVLQHESVPPDSNHRVNDVNDVIRTPVHKHQ